MKFLLDTDICSYIIRNELPSVKRRLSKMPEGSLSISAITAAELLFGITKKPSIAEMVTDFISLLSVVPFDKSAALKYADIRSSLEKNGHPIGNMDMMIAAVALVNDLVLVTNNQKHFSRIKDLKIENWV